MSRAPGLDRVGVRTLYIEKASPWENDCNEAFNSKLHDEPLNGEIFYSLKEARILIEAWRRHDNTERPHWSSAIARQPRRSCRGCLASLVTGRSAGYSSHGVWYHDPLLVTGPLIGSWPGRARGHSILTPSQQAVPSDLNSAKHLEA